MQWNLYLFQKRYAIDPPYKELYYRYCNKLVLNTDRNKKLYKT